MISYFENLLTLYIDMAFYIAIGLLFTGLLHAFIKNEAILKRVGKNSIGSVTKASIIGVPLPLCSCGVVPTAIYLGKNGASKGAVVSFLTSTPQTGIDSLIATYGILGPLFAIYRAVTAFISGIISGVITNIFCKKEKTSYETSASSCCSQEQKEPEPKQCCCSCSQNKPTTSALSKLKKGFTYAFGEFLGEITIHFIIGLLIAALISTLLPADIFTKFDNPILTMIIMVGIGIPMYICSTASIPIALSLIIKGISPGAAFVFLFAGPVTNIASLAILTKTLGKKITTIYVISASVCAVAFGLAFDYIISMSNYSGLSNLINHSHKHEVPIYMTIVAGLFGILIARNLFIITKNKINHKCNKC